MTPRPVGIGILALALLVLPGTAATAEPTPAASASFGLVLSHDTATATLIADPSGDVTHTAIYSETLDFNEPEEMEPGIWVATADYDPFGPTCHEASAEVVLAWNAQPAPPPVTDSKQCFVSLTVQHVPSGQLFSFDGADLPKNTELEFDGDHGEYHTSCSQCLRPGDASGNFVLTEVVGAQRFSEKCSEDGTKSSKSTKGKKSKKNKKSQKGSSASGADEDAGLLIELHTQACRENCNFPG